MKAYIRSTSCISPQKSFDHEIFYQQPVEYTNNFLAVIEPDYTSIFDIKQLRRMSRIMRMGLAPAIRSVQEAGLESVDAIITGTAYGCMEESEKFLKKIIELDETMLSPTPFIQSTHNTVGAQIALFLKCHAYNNTFAHRSFSFEHTVIDAMLLLHENKAKHILTGSADEITEFTFGVLQRFGLYKQEPVSNFDLYTSGTRGSIVGEGAAFFVLSNEVSEMNYARIDDLELLQKTNDIPAIQSWMENFLQKNNLTAQDIDLVITGRNGDFRGQKFYDAIEQSVFSHNTIINYKHLCGEYPTSSSFAAWLAANILKMQQLPVCFNKTPDMKQAFKNALIYNFYQGRYHSLILLSAIN
ncbi:MAG: beta-ketoacyl synthase chain length factor [Bacteroidetes bacterium]|nr:beta-ketoacyl synthase chain length factor [Bacteroidota bacterium]